MSIFHCSVKVISAGKGRSAVAASAYRSGEKLYDEKTGIEHDYTRKKAGKLIEGQQLIGSEADSAQPKKKGFITRLFRG